MVPESNVLGSSMNKWWREETKMGPRVGGYVTPFFLPSEDILNKRVGIKEKDPDTEEGRLGG